MRILSGIQPSGRLHLGNYFGMMLPAIQLQQGGECLYFIADYHAQTTVHNAKELREYVNGIAVDFLAAGLDPERSIFFRQSDVPEVTELSWILSTVTPMGLLERCHSYKDKLARGIAASHGLFCYPVLMAADILIYNSNLVPVGRDQKQHLEVTCDIAEKFNNMYGNIFTIPEPLIQADSAHIPGTDGQKMSKSYNNGIYLSEDEKSFRKKIMSLKTDSTPVELPKSTQDSLILQLYKLVATPEEYAAMENSFLSGGRGYGDYKKTLADALWNHFAPYRKRRHEILSSPDYIDNVLQDGAKRARAIARETMRQVRKATGLGDLPPC